ncbi:MAG: DUF5060 domain-containing protein [Planctomycetota bacterium]|nr:DUF5060 domain-containing protein [Planctomycetota bacterium]
MPRYVLLSLTLCLAVGHARPAETRPMRDAELIADLSLNATSVPRYGRAELTFRINAAVANPFDPGEIDVTAVVRTPSGKHVAVPGFYYQDFTRSTKGADEKLTARGQTVWKVRYAPLERGTHSIWVEVGLRAGRYESPVLQFRCVSGPSHGFVRCGDGQPRLFELDDGTPYFPVGMNVCWGRNTQDYERWLGKLEANGCTWARLWIGPWDLFTLENTTGLGRYDQAAAWRLDYVTELAERKGIYLMFCLESFNSLRASAPNEYWQGCPYNSANAGPCNIPEEFFTNAEARRLFRQRLRYITARWGYSTHVFAWELWNEVDIIEEYVAAEVAPWHAEMARCLKRLDPNRHMITTSFANSPGDPAVDGLREMSFVQTHSYGAADIAGELRRYCLDKAARYRKPHIVGEFGLDADAKGNGQDPEGEHMHEGIWASSLSLAAGTAMIWWWDNYIEPRNLYHHYKPLARFFAGVDWGEHELRPAQAGFRFTGAYPGRVLDVRIAGRHNVWEDHPSNRPLTVTVQRDGTVIGADNLGANLHGLVNHKPWHNPVTFETECGREWVLAVTVAGVNQYGGATLKIFVDDELFAACDFVTDQSRDKETVTRFNGEYSIEVPAGKHSIRVVNAGRDWLLCSYKLLGYALKTTPDLRAFGMQDDTLALLWIQNETASRYARTMEIKPQTVEHAVLTVNGLRKGRYLVEWWDTTRGEVRREHATATDGALTIPVPPVATDIAVKLRRL